MRNVTIVESNVEPNKEHLWFYRGELKWFGPNGWETVTTSDIEPKYIFKKNSSIESLQFDLANGTNGITVEVLSYTESKGIKKEVPISVSFQSGGTIAGTNNIYYNPIGIYNPSIFPKSVGYDIAFIKGAEGRSIIIPITVVNTSNTTTTTTSTSTPAPTTTPSPVTTTTTTTRIATALGVRVYNYTDSTVNTTVTAGLNSISEAVSASGNRFIYGVMPSTVGGTISLQIASTDGTITTFDVEIIGNVGSTSINQNQSISNGGTINIPYTSNDALYDNGISLIMSISSPTSTATTTTVAPNVE